MRLARQIPCGGLETAAASLLADHVSWPVMQDNDHYQSQSRPSFYIVDRRGLIRDIHMGRVSSRFPDAVPGLETTVQNLMAGK